MKDFTAVLAHRFSALPHTMQFVLIVLGIALVLTAVFTAGKKYGSLEAQNAFAGKLKAGRADAVKRSRAVLSGQLAEQIAPFLPDFPCNPADARFVGKPVDFIAFPGAADGKCIAEILFIEVKSGTAALSEREKEIKAAVSAGKVRYVEYRIPRAREALN